MTHREKKSYAMQGRKSQADTRKYNNKPASLASIKVLPCMCTNLLVPHTKFPNEILPSHRRRVQNSQQPILWCIPPDEFEKKAETFQISKPNKFEMNITWEYQGRIYPTRFLPWEDVDTNSENKNIHKLTFKSSCRARKLWKGLCSLRRSNTRDAEKTDAQQCMLPSFDGGHGGVTEMQASTRRGVDSTIFRQTWR